MPKLPPLPPPTVLDIIRIGTPMQMWCNFCNQQYAVRREELSAWADKHPPRLRRFAMEVPRMMRCKFCGNQTLNGLLSGSIDYMSGPEREPTDQQNDE